QREVHDGPWPEPQEILKEEAVGDPNHGLSQRRALDLVNEESAQQILGRVGRLASFSSPGAELPEVRGRELENLRVGVEHVADPLELLLVLSYDLGARPRGPLEVTLRVRFQTHSNLLEFCSPEDRNAFFLVKRAASKRRSGQLARPPDSAS